MIISHEHKFVYLPPIKTGTTTLQHVLKQFGARRYFFDRDNINLKGSHHDVGQHKRYVPKKYEDYFIFCSIRNPYTRLISQFHWWLNFSTKKICFRQFLDFISSNSLVPRHRGESISAWLGQEGDYRAPKDCIEKIKIDVFVKLENIEEDFSNLPFVNHYIKMPYLNKQKKYKIEYTEELVEWVQKHRSMDFDLGNYSKECPKVKKIAPPILI